jgi:hypothetical protein
VWLVCFLDRNRFEFFVFAVDGCCIDMLYIRTDKFFDSLDNNAAVFPILMVRSLIFLSCVIFP